MLPVFTEELYDQAVSSDVGIRKLCEDGAIFVEEEHRSGIGIAACFTKTRHEELEELFIKSGSIGTDQA